MPATRPADGPPLRFFAEVLGLSPLRERLRQTAIVLRGAEDVPPARSGLSSLRLLRPRVAWPLWRGRPYLDRQVVITTLFNYRQTPIEAGWSVRKTQVEDFRGRDLTYDSHNGTDFAIPVGTRVLAVAPAVVAKIGAEFNRGGLKVYLDHGDGLMTSYAHLARPLVREGDRVARGQPIALSGYSGLDAVVSFPLGVPHVHFNTWLDGEPICPFGRPGEGSMWLGGAGPVPFSGAAPAPGEVVDDYDEAAVDGLIAACKTPSVRARLAATEPLARRAAHTIIESNYYPTRFTQRRNPYRRSHPRAPRMSLPFSAEDFDGVVFVDDLP